jgi:hypothetical protein
MLVAAIPGLTTLALLLGLGLIRFVAGGIDFRAVYAIAFVPAFLQWMFLRRELVSTTPNGIPERPVAAVPRWFYVAATIFFLAASSASMLRANLAARQERFAGLLLVALNSTFSLSFTFSKILFLEGNTKSRVHHTMAIALLAGISLFVLAIVPAFHFGFAVTLALLLVIQVAMSVVISAVREYLHSSLEDTSTYVKVS